MLIEETFLGERYVDKPLGYSWFHKELAPVPVAWVRKTGKLEWYRRHNKVSREIFNCKA